MINIVSTKILTLNARNLCLPSPNICKSVNKDNAHDIISKIINYDNAYENSNTTLNAYVTLNV